MVVAATGEPTSLVPPLVFETVGRDIGDQVFERLADLGPGARPDGCGGLPAGPGRAVGTDRLADLALPSAAGRPMA